MFYFDMPLHGSVQRCSAFDLLLLTFLSVLGDHSFLMALPGSHMEAVCVCCMCACMGFENMAETKIKLKRINTEGGWCRKEEEVEC